MNSMSGMNSKMILAIRNGGETDVKTMTFNGDDAISIVAALKVFLFDNFKINDFACQRITGTQGEVIDSFLVRFEGNDEFYSVYTSKPRINSNSSSVACSNDTKQVDNDDLIHLIYGLVMEGYLSFLPHSLNINKLTQETMPLILLARLEQSYKGCDGTYFIQDFATNDQTLIDIAPHGNDDTTPFSYDHVASAQNLMLQMVNRGDFTESKLLPKVESPHQSVGYKVVFGGEYPYQLSVRDLTDRDQVSNSILLSNSFLHAFALASNKILDFNYKITTKESAVLQSDDGSDLNIIAAAALTAADDDILMFIKQSLNLYLFNNDANDSINTPAKTLVACVIDNNQERQTIDVELHKHSKPVVYYSDIEGSPTNKEIEYFTLSYTKSNQCRRNVKQISVIHKSYDMAALIDEMAEELKAHNSLYKNKGMLTELLSNAFNTNLTL